MCYTLNIKYTCYVMTHLIILHGVGKFLSYARSSWFWYFIRGVCKGNQLEHPSNHCQCLSNLSYRTQLHCGRRFCIGHFSKCGHDPSKTSCAVMFELWWGIVWFLFYFLHCVLIVWGITKLFKVQKTKGWAVYKNTVGSLQSTVYRSVFVFIWRKLELETPLGHFWC